MPKVQATEPEPPAPRVLRQCPSCAASVFQGPYYRGEIVNGKLEPRETLFQCVSCHKVSGLDELPERVSPAGP